MKVVLATIHLEPSTRAIPLAAACLKVMADKHDILLQDYYLGQSPELAARCILDESPDAAGFPVYLWNRSMVVETIRLIKKMDPRVRIMVGGPEVTAAPDKILADCPADAAVQGEGEPLINPILDAFEEGREPPRLPGLWTAGSSPVSASVCRDFNSLPSPILEGGLDLSDNPGLLWELSRGCPFACDFCFESKGSGLVRTLSLERVEQELHCIQESGIRQVFVLDPTFNVKKDRVLAILDLIREYTPETYFYFEIRSEFLDEETAEAFAGVPCTLQIGLQSSSPEVLKNLNRTFSPEKFREKTALLSRAGVSFGLDLIYGLPGDSLAGFRRSLDYALSLEPNHLDIFPLAVLPGTVLYDRASGFGLEHSQEDPYLVIGSPAFPPRDIAAASALAAAADELYNQGKAVSWFSRVCTDLNVSPSALTDRWIKLYDSSEDLQEEELSGRIRDFLLREYEEAGIGAEGIILRDILSYLEILGDLEECGETAEYPETGVLLTEDTVLKGHPSMILRPFRIHPRGLETAYHLSTAELLNASRSEDFFCLFWSREWEICMECPEPDECTVLNQLAGPVAMKDIELPPARDREWLSGYLLESVLEGYVQIL